MLHGKMLIRVRTGSGSDWVLDSFRFKVASKIPSYLTTVGPSVRSRARLIVFCIRQFSFRTDITSLDLPKTDVTQIAHTLGSVEDLFPSQRVPKRAVDNWLCDNRLAQHARLNQVFWSLDRRPANGSIGVAVGDLYRTGDTK